jgi:hypothetical protein
LEVEGDELLREFFGVVTTHRFEVAIRAENAVEENHGCHPRIDVGAELAARDTVCYRPLDLLPHGTPLADYFVEAGVVTDLLFILLDYSRNVGVRCGLGYRNTDTAAVDLDRVVGLGGDLLEGLKNR